MTNRQALREADRRILRRDAETLLIHLLERDRAWLLSYLDDELSKENQTRFGELVRRRAAGEPLQYITGWQEFFGLRFRVSPDVLIPRPETEHLVEEVVQWVSTRPSPVRIVDVGTGSGAIALALAQVLHNAQTFAVDNSTRALRVAEENAKRLALESRVRFAQADLLSSLEMEVDVVVSNPPYIPDGDALSMQREVVDHEPHNALFAGRDGLDVYRRLIPQAHKALKRGGLLAMEIGFGQEPALDDLLQDWHAVRFTLDYAGIPRVVLAERA